MQGSTDEADIRRKVLESLTTGLQNRSRSRSARRRQLAASLLEAFDQARERADRQADAQR